MNKYELCVVLNAKLEDEQRNAEIEKIKGYVSRFGGSVEEPIEEWGKRKFAYTIKHMNEGYYYFIHFDAKYQMYVDSEKFKNEDIVKMHAYKDAIQNTIGAYVIYPGSNHEIYYENNVKVKSVGAFGLIPGEEKIDKIKQFIVDLIDEIKFLEQ